MTNHGSRGEARGRAFPAVLLLLSTVLAFGCRTGADHPTGVALTHTFTSPAAAAAAVVDALAREDLEALHALPLSEHEFRTVVWPELPSSRPEVNLPLVYAWATLKQNSLGSLASMFAAQAGRQYDVMRVEFDGKTTRYHTFVVHREARVIVRHPDGAERRLALFGSLLEREGRFKIFSYVTD